MEKLIHIKSQQLVSVSSSQRIFLSFSQNGDLSAGSFQPQHLAKRRPAALSHHVERVAASSSQRLKRPRGSQGRGSRQKPEAQGGESHRALSQRRHSASATSTWETCIFILLIFFL